MGLLATVKAQSSGKAQNGACQQMVLETGPKAWHGWYEEDNKEVSHVLNMTNFGITDLNTKSYFSALKVM